MRIEQIVLYGPGNDERVTFGRGVTVYAGLGPQERQDLTETIVDALRGGLANASVIYTDDDGERIFADRTGASYAASGAPAPAPVDLLGQDRAALLELLRLDAQDLGLGATPVSPEELREELAVARVELESMVATHDDVVEQAELIETWRASMVELGRRIDGADEQAARWAWLAVRRRFDELQAERNLVEQADLGRSDDQVLQSVDAVRSAGESWTSLAARTAKRRAELGGLPKVRPEDLDRVAATPAEPPAGFPARLEAWQAAADLRRSAEAERALVDRPVPEPDDALVLHFASLEQDRLWALHREAELANQLFDEQAAVVGRSQLDPESEQRIEEAHLEVVRCQRDVDRRFRPGVLGTGALAVGALLAGQAVALTIGIAMLAASLVMAGWLLLAPRRRLAVANIVERDALAHADADSWLGLHLRRVDTVADTAARKRFDQAADARAAAQIDWDELAGPHGPAELIERADAVRAHAEATRPDLVARRREEAGAFARAAQEAESAALASLTNGLDPYGLVAGGGVDLDPGRLPALLEQRIRAGSLARAAKELHGLEQREADAGRHLDVILSRLGYDDGDLESRLERAIAGIDAARVRQSTGHRSQTELEAEINDLQGQVEAGVARGWSDGADPAGPPTDPALLQARRHEIEELIVEAGSPDVAGARRDLEASQDHVDRLEQRLEELVRGPASVQARLMARCGRTAWVGDCEESVPVLVDEALLSVPVAQRMDLLDLLTRLTDHVQIIVLTADPVVARWARQRAERTDVCLYEAEPELDPMVRAEDYQPLGFAPQLP